MIQNRLFPNSPFTKVQPLLTSGPRGYGPHAHAHYAAVEERNGEWAVIEITHGAKSGGYTEFHERHLEARNCKTEAEALDAIRGMHHGVDLRNEDFFFRIVIQA